MSAPQSEQRFVIPRSFVRWGAILCAIAVTAVVALCLTPVLTGSVRLNLVDEQRFVSEYQVAVLSAFCTVFAGLLVGIVLNGYLPTLLFPSPRQGLSLYRALLRGSVTSRFVLAFWTSAIAAFLSVWVVGYPIGQLANLAFTLATVVLLFPMCRRYLRFSRTAGRTPLYAGLSDEELGGLFRPSRLDDRGEWESVVGISAPERAEAYRQLARGRYLSLRLLSALITAIAGTAIAAALSWVVIEPTGLSMAVALVPIFILLLAQYMQFLAEQYDALSDRYAERGRELAAAVVIEEEPPLLLRRFGRFALTLNRRRVLANEGLDGRTRRTTDT